VGTSEVIAGDTFLLCSDGVSGMLPPEAIRTFLANHEGSGPTAARLIASSLQAGGRDNATAIVIDIA
jgi:protein phosphatase